MKHAVILYNPVTSDAREDELDVLTQVEFLEKILPVLGYNLCRMEFSLNLEDFVTGLRKVNPDIVFNLVETVYNQGKLSFIAPAVLESFGFPFSGSGTKEIFTTTDKTICKSILQYNGISTPDWAKTITEVDPEKIYIIKPICEDGSVGIEDDLLLTGHQMKKIPEGCFAEEYIHGREFNISVIGGVEGPLVLPPAEMRFLNYDEYRPRILGYKAKWEENSFEYLNTSRTFIFNPEDEILLKELKAISLNCWNIFNLKGYARVDFRVDSESIPKVIDINANPCISPDSGFISACRESGLTDCEILKKIIEDAERKFPGI